MENIYELKRNYWLWVTGQEYYSEIDDSGKPRCRIELNPGYDDYIDCRWSCHKDTKKGDLILLYRKKYKSFGKDISHLFQATSDAKSVYGVEDLKESWESEGDVKWAYYCEYKSIYEFKKTLTMEEYLKTSNKKTQSLQGKCHKIDPTIWSKLSNSLNTLNPGYKNILDKLEKNFFVPSIKNEPDLQVKLCHNLNLLKRYGYDNDFEFFQQFHCKGSNGRVDILLKNKVTFKYVVIELKSGWADTDACGQILYYINWVEEKYKTKVPGLIIADGADTKLLYAIKNLPVTFIDYKDLGFKKIKVTKNETRL